MTRKTAAEAPAHEVAEAAADPTKEWGEVPQTGGCFIRNADGTLVRDPDVHGAEAGNEEA